MRFTIIGVQQSLYSKILILLCFLLGVSWSYPFLLCCTDTRWKTVGEKWGMGTTTRDSTVVCACLSLSHTN